MLNKVMIIGRLGQDPELRYSSSGMPVTTLNVATDESYVDRDGNKVERTEWHRVSVFQKMAENCAKFLGKGSLVYVEGSLQTRKWQDKQGQDRYSTDIRAQRVQFLDRRDSRQSRDADDNAQPRTYSQSDKKTFQSPSEDLGPAFPSEAATMDEMPF